MKQIKVTYRAVFAQPIGKLNPSELSMGGEFPVEVFGNGDNWQAREIATPARAVYKKLSRFASAENGKATVESSFRWFVQGWQIWGIPPMGSHESRDRILPERILEPDEIMVLRDGRVLWKEADDYTHIIHAPTLNAREKIPHAACGAQVKAESFISTKANLEPTCKACAQAWREHYQEKSA